MNSRVKGKLAINGGPKLIAKSEEAVPSGAFLIGNEENKAVNEIIDSKSLFRYYGENLRCETQRFEQDVCEYFNVQYGLALNSGTSALICALSAFGVGPGDEVIVSGYTWIAVINAIVLMGCLPVLAEIDETFNIDPEDVKRKITKNTKVIIAVHMNGASTEMASLKKIAQSHNLYLLEDASQSIGATYDDKYLGAIGDIGIFSLQYNKNITCGEGGVLMTNNYDFLRRAQSFHDLGFTRGNDGKAAMGEEQYNMFGFTFRMNEIVAAVARVQLKKLSEVLYKQRIIKNKIKEAIMENDIFVFRTIPGGNGDSANRLKLIMKNEELAERFNRAAEAERLPLWLMKNAGLNVYWNMSNLLNKRTYASNGFPWKYNDRYKEIKYFKGMLPQTESLLNRSLVIYLSIAFSDSYCNDIIDAINKIIYNFKKNGSSPN